MQRPVRFATFAVVLASALVCATSRSEVLGADAPGFVTRIIVSVAAPPAHVYARFLEIGRWWNDEHTYSGKAANMTLNATPSGCFCESLADGGFIEHGRVTYAAPGKALRVSAPFGPLHEMGGAGTLTAKFEAEGGGGTKLTLHFVGMGFEPRTGLAAMAPLYDQVFADAMQRLKRYAEVTRKQQR